MSFERICYFDKQYHLTPDYNHFTPRQPHYLSKKEKKRKLCTNISNYQQGGGQDPGKRTDGDLLEYSGMSNILRPPPKIFLTKREPTLKLVPGANHYEELFLLIWYQCGLSPIQKFSCTQYHCTPTYQCTPR